MNKEYVFLNENNKNNREKNKRNIPQPPLNVQKPGKNFVFFFFVLMVMGVFFFFMSGNRGDVVQVSYSKFLSSVSNQEILSVKIIERDLYFNYKVAKVINGKSLSKGVTYIPYHDPGLLPILQKNSVTIRGEAKSENSFLQIIFSLLPWIVLIFFVWFILVKQMQGGGNKAMSFGKSKAKLFNAAQKKVTFEDVAGIEEAKTELREVIEFLVEPEKFRRLGARIPRGVLLVGPPGTGKTLLARAVAGEAGVPFFSISGSDFVEMFVGVGASRVRDLFSEGKKKAPCILFIDELDAVGRSRGAGYGGGHDEREQTLNQMLVEMDGFEESEEVIIIAATNRPDVLDPALLRPGRFDRQVVVDAPDVKGREKILEVHTQKVPISKNVDLAIIARGTPGFTGADLANMVNEAALFAARKNKKKIMAEDFEEAKDKVLMGPERRSLVIHDDEKKNTAYHEAGHALLGFLLPNTDPIHKITIIPRGRALGLTQSLPVDERHNNSKNFLMDQLALLLGGRVAEEFLSDGNITTGASNDIERATKVARAMVCEWGMSEVMGPISYGEKEHPIFLAKEVSHQRDYSEKVAQQIDDEIKDIIDVAHEKARKLIRKYSKPFIVLAEELLKNEVIDAQRFIALMEENGVKKLSYDEIKKIVSEKKKTSVKKKTAKKMVKKTVKKIK